MNIEVFIRFGLADKGLLEDLTVGRIDVFFCQRACIRVNFQQYFRQSAGYVNNIFAFGGMGLGKILMRRKYAGYTKKADCRTKT